MSFRQRTHTPAGYQSYEHLIARAAASEPQVETAPKDTWTLMYTSGTTGRPKGAMRSQDERQPAARLLRARDGI